MTRAFLVGCGVGVVMVAALAWGCSGNSTDVGTNGGSDSGAGSDGTVQPDGNGGTPDAGSKDSATPVDSSTGKDSAPPIDATPGVVACPVNSCSSGNVCCLTIANDGGVDPQCLSSCPDGGLPVACDGPEDCSGGTPYCCGTATTGPGSFPDCPLESGSAKCTASCNGDVKVTCASTSTTRRCHVKADCAGDPQYSECCTFTNQGLQTTFCATTSLAAFADSCH